MPTLVDLCNPIALRIPSRSLSFTRRQRRRCCERCHSSVCHWRPQMKMWDECIRLVGGQPVQNQAWRCTGWSLVNQVGTRIGSRPPVAHRIAARHNGSRKVSKNPAPTASQKQGISQWRISLLRLLVQKPPCSSRPRNSRLPSRLRVN
jgi:hypothetical protein